MKQTKIPLWLRKKAHIFAGGVPIGYLITCSDVSVKMRITIRIEIKKKLNKYFANVLTDEDESHFKLSPYQQFSNQAIVLNIMNTML